LLLSNMPHMETPRVEEESLTLMSELRDRSVSLDTVLKLIARERSVREAACSDLLIRIRGGELEQERRLTSSEERLNHLESHISKNTAPKMSTRSEQSLEQLSNYTLSQTSEHSGEVSETLRQATGRLADAEGRIAKLELTVSNLELDMMEMQRWRTIRDAKVDKPILLVPRKHHTQVDSLTDVSPISTIDTLDASLPKWQDHSRLSYLSNTSSSIASDYTTFTNSVHTSRFSTQKRSIGDGGSKLTQLDPLKPQVGIGYGPHS